MSSLPSRFIHSSHSCFDATLEQSHAALSWTWFTGSLACSAATDISDMGSAANLNMSRDTSTGQRNVPFHRSKIRRETLPVEQLVHQLFIRRVHDLVLDQSLPRQTDSDCHGQLTLFTIGMKIAKSGPNCRTSTHSVSMAMSLSSASVVPSVLINGCMI